MDDAYLYFLRIEIDEMSLQSLFQPDFSTFFVICFDISFSSRREGFPSALL